MRNCIGELHLGIQSLLHCILAVEDDEAKVRSLGFAAPFSPNVAAAGFYNHTSHLHDKIQCLKIF